MNRTLSISAILFISASVACEPLPNGPDKTDSAGDVDASSYDVEAGDDSNAGNPSNTSDDDAEADGSSDSDGSSYTGEFQHDVDYGDTGDHDEPDDGFDREPPSAERFAALTDSVREQMTQEYTVDASYYIYLVGEQGTILNIPQGSMANAAGEYVTGRVDIELIELYDKGSMLVTDMPSTGRNAAGEQAQLISGGEHFIDASQDGEALELVSEIQIDAPVALTGDADPDMIRFRAINEDGDLAGRDDAAVWVEDDDKVNIGRAEGGTDGVQTTYQLLTANFGWTNVDRWYSDPREKTTIQVRPPVGWDDSNSAVYLSYDGEATALAGLDTWDDEDGLFSEHYGLIPVGLEVHVIFVTATDTGWAYDIQGTTIVADQEISFDDADALIDIDTDGLVDVINDLP